MKGKQIMIKQEDNSEFCFHKSLWVIKGEKSGSCYVVEPEEDEEDRINSGNNPINYTFYDLEITFEEAT